MSDIRIKPMETALEKQEGLYMQLWCAIEYQRQITDR